MIGRHVAPAGAPIRLRDIVSWAHRWRRLDDSADELRSAICERLDRRHCHLTSTGRAGLTTLLSALRTLVPTERDEVILPSYTCFSVAASTVRARLRLHIVDVDPRTLDFDLERLGNADFRRVLAVVSTSLYGLPGRLSRIAQIAQDRAVFMIDDAAQSLGASLDGRQSGGWGDAGLLSFDKGKAVSAIEGGAIVTDSDAVSRAIEQSLQHLHRPSPMATLGHLLKLAAYVTCLRPELYWIPNSLPGLGLGQTVYRPDFAMQRESRWLASLAAVAWTRLEEFTTARVANAERYRAGISRTESVSSVQPVDGAHPAYLRYPILVRPRPRRDRLVRELVRAGIGATTSYHGSLADIAEARSWFACEPDADVGRSVAASIVTLPTHPYVSAKDIERAVGIVSNVAGLE